MGHFEFRNILTAGLVGLFLMTSAARLSPAEEIGYSNYVDNQSSPFQQFTAPVMNNFGVTAFLANDGLNRQYIAWANGYLSNYYTGEGPFFHHFQTPAIDDYGNIVFWAATQLRDPDTGQIVPTADGGETGIFRMVNGNLQTIIKENWAQGISAFFEAPAGNRWGEAVFLASMNEIDHSRDQLLLVDLLRMSTSGGYGVVATNRNAMQPFVQFSSPVISASGNFAVITRLDDSYNGIEIVYNSAAGYSPNPNVVRFGQIFQVSMNAFDALAFTGVTENGTKGVFVTDRFNAIYTLASTEAGYTDVASAAISYYGDVFFYGTSDAYSGIVLQQPWYPNSQSIIKIGDPLFGSTVASIGFNAAGVNEQGWVSFSYLLNNGRQGIAVAYPAGTRPMQNGDFNEGLSGWDLAMMDHAGNPIDMDDPQSPAPPITAPTASGGNVVARLKTSAFDEGVGVATLRQLFLVPDVAAPNMSLDFTDLIYLPDPTGSGTSLLHDRIEVSLEADNGNSRYLMAVLGFDGVTLDPLGEYPGVVLLGPATNPAFDFALLIGLIPFSNERVRLVIDVINEDDHYLLDPDLDNIIVTPEPGSAAMIVGVAVMAFRRRRTRRGA